MEERRKFKRAGGVCAAFVTHFWRPVETILCVMRMVTHIGVTALFGALQATAAVFMVTSFIYWLLGRVNEQQQQYM